MKRKIIFKIVVDIGMTFVLLLLMAYQLIGEAAHEWLGIGMFVLLVIHHILNSRWSRNVFKGKYSPMRILQTVLVAGVFLTMAGSMLSGIVLSEYALSFLPIKGGREFARILHMLSAYWGFVMMSLHLGLHWNMVVGMLKKLPKVSKWLSRIGILIALYGVYAFTHREIGRYMTLKNHFAFFDFEEPLIFFLADYIAIMALFVVVGYCLFNGIKCAVRWRNSL